MQQWKCNKKNGAWAWKQDFWNDYYVKHPVVFLLLCTYTLLGAMIFVTFERPEQNRLESERCRELEEIRKVGFANFSLNLFNTSELLIFLDPTRYNRALNIIRSNLLQFEVELFGHFQRRDPRTLQWDMWNASVFAMSTYTTIGYKNLYPVTLFGKLAVILYTLIGIPLLLAVLVNFTSVINHLLKFSWRKTVTVCNKFRKTDKDSLLFIEIPFLYALSFCLICIFVCPATCLLWKDEWSYMDAFYFVFMSLSTIGMARMDEFAHPAFYFLISFYVVLALASISVCFKLAICRLTSRGGQQIGSRLYRSPPFPRLASGDYCNEDFVHSSPLARKWINDLKMARFSNRAVSECDEIKSDEKTSLESLPVDNGPFRSKMPFFSANNKLTFKSMDTVNMLMDAYKEELLWLVRSGRYSSEEQSIADMNRAEDDYDTIIANCVAR